MSAALLDGKALSARMRERLGQEAAALPRQPGLAVILVGDDPASAVYVRNKEKDCAQCDRNANLLPEYQTECGKRRQGNRATNRHWQISP